MENVICTKCQKEIDWLEVFPGNICLECHAKNWTPLPADCIKRIGQ